MSRINGDRARSDKQRKHREKLRVRNKALREELVTKAKAGVVAAPKAESK
jgi:hypothetical protein